MAIDRDAALKEAEQLLRQGKLDGAIDAYLRLVDDRPSDWSSINALGDLCLRAGDVERAIAQFTRVADQFFSDGSLQKAAALYKKALRAQDDHEPALQQLGEIAVRQGLQADAEVYLQRLADRRRRRGDDDGAEKLLARLHALKESQTQSRIAAAHQREADAHPAAAPAAAKDETEAAGSVLTGDAATDDVASLPAPSQVPEAEEPSDGFTPEAPHERGFSGGLRRADHDVPTDDDVTDRNEASPLVEVPVEVDVPPEAEVPLESEAPLEIEASLEVELGDALDELTSAPADTVAAPDEIASAPSDGVAALDGIESAPSDTVDANLSPSPSDRERAPEIGQLDSAGVDVAALESAARDPATRFAAAATLGRHFIRQGDARAAIRWLERAVEATPANREETFSVLYDLADALESVGESPRALAVLIDLDLDSGGYRDGRARIDRFMMVHTGSDGS